MLSLLMPDGNLRVPIATNQNTFRPRGPRILLYPQPRHGSFEAERMQFISRQMRLSHLTSAGEEFGGAARRSR